MNSNITFIHLIEGTERYGVASFLRTLVKNFDNIQFVALKNGPMIKEVPKGKILWIGDDELEIKINKSSLRGLFTILLKVSTFHKISRNIFEILPKKEKVIFHCHSIFTLLVCSLIKIRSRKRVKVIFHFHSTMNKSRLFGLLPIIQRMIVNRTISAFISVSNTTKKYWEPIKHPTWVIYNCVDDLEIQGPPSYYQKREGVKDIIFAGSFCIDKGYMVLLEGMKLLGDKLKSYHFWVAGGPLEVELNPFAQKCFDFVLENNLRENITFLGHVENIRSLIPHMWAGLQLRISPEPFGIWTLEMMNAGIPIIATNTGGTTELIQHLQNGILIPPNNPIALIDALLDLDLQNDLRAQLAINARRSSLNYTSSVFVKQIQQVYDSFL